jgi:hypothetical protein
MRTSPALAALVVVAFAAPALANPIPTYITPSGIAHSGSEVFVLGAIAALLEWIVLRDGLRGHVRSERGLALVVAAAHLLSYPATVSAAYRVFDWTFNMAAYVKDHGELDRAYWWMHAAELVAVAVEFAVYFAAFRLWRRSPVAPPPTVGRLLGLTVFANALTWSLGMGWSAWWHGAI